LRETSVYKRSTFSMIKGIVAAPFSGLIVCFFCSFLLSDRNSMLLGVAVAMIILYISVFGENIRIEVDDKELRYYKGKKMLASYMLDNISVGYNSKIESGFLGNQDITLRIYDMTTDTEAGIDCSPIGSRKFDELYEYLESKTHSETEVLSVKKNNGE